MTLWFEEVPLYLGEKYVSWLSGLAGEISETEIVAVISKIWSFWGSSGALNFFSTSWLEESLRDGDLREWYFHHWPNKLASMHTGIMFGILQKYTSTSPTPGSFLTLSTGQRKLDISGCQSYAFWKFSFCHSLIEWCQTNHFLYFPTAKWDDFLFWRYDVELKEFLSTHRCRNTKHNRMFFLFTPLFFLCFLG